VWGESVIALSSNRLPLVRRPYLKLGTRGEAPARGRVRRSRRRRRRPSRPRRGRCDGCQRARGRDAPGRSASPLGRRLGDALFPRSSSNQTPCCSSRRPRALETNSPTSWAKSAALLGPHVCSALARLQPTEKTRERGLHGLHGTQRFSAKEGGTRRALERRARLLRVHRAWPDEGPDDPDRGGPRAGRHLGATSARDQRASAVSICVASSHLGAFLPSSSRTR